MTLAVLTSEDPCRKSTALAMIVGNAQDVPRSMRKSRRRNRVIRRLPRNIIGRHGHAHADVFTALQAREHLARGVPRPLLTSAVVWASLRCGAGAHHEGPACLRNALEQHCASPRAHSYVGSNRATRQRVSLRGVLAKCCRQSERLRSSACVFGADSGHLRAQYAAG